MGRDKFFDLLRNNHLLIKSKRCRTKTTCSYHHFNRYKNLIVTAVPLRCNEIWVADITYLWLKPQDRFCYLSVITDLYSRKIVGWAFSDSLATAIVSDALNMAVQQRKPTGSLIFHSDRGCQYASAAYRTALTLAKITPSMSRKGCCYDNAVAESFYEQSK